MASKSQVNKFKALAREIGCDENEKPFDRALKGIAKPAKNSTAKKLVMKAGKRQPS